MYLYLVIARSKMSMQKASPEEDYFKGRCPEEDKLFPYWMSAPDPRSLGWTMWEEKALLGVTCSCIHVEVAGTDIATNLNKQLISFYLEYQGRNGDNGSWWSTFFSILSLSPLTIGRWVLFWSESVDTYKWFIRPSASCTFLSHKEAAWSNGFARGLNRQLYWKPGAGTKEFTPGRISSYMVIFWYGRSRKLQHISINKCRIRKIALNYLILSCRMSFLDVARDLGILHVIDAPE